MTQTITQTQIEALRDYARENKSFHGESYPVSACSYAWYDCDGVTALGVKFDVALAIEGDTYAGVAFGAPRGHLSGYYRLPMPLTADESEANRLAAEEKSAVGADRLILVRLIASEFGAELRGMSAKLANWRVKQIAALHGQRIYWSEVKSELAA